MARLVVTLRCISARRSAARSRQRIAPPVRLIAVHVLTAGRWPMCDPRNRLPEGNSGLFMAQACYDTGLKTTRYRATYLLRRNQ
jgi:hypothetical protein